MPTGYTAMIEDRDDVTFEEYAWTCARAFGALVEMRDEPMAARIPRKLVPSNYHEKELTKARLHVAQLEEMTLDDVRAATDAYNRKAAEDYEATLLQYRAKLAKYDAILAKVDGWEPPTPDHGDFKAFMRQQIDVSTSYDREFVADPERQPKSVTTSEWMAQQLKSAQWALDYHAKGWAEECRRTDERNAWIDALRKSIGDQP